MPPSTSRSAPWEMGGCPTSERFGVVPGSNGWWPSTAPAGLSLDGATARPRAATAARMWCPCSHGLFRQHGIWQRLCLESGRVEVEQ